jgi:hypothetical protein
MLIYYVTAVGVVPKSRSRRIIIAIPKSRRNAGKLPKSSPLIRNLVAIAFILTAAGCIYIPGPLAEDLPLKPLRKVTVSDAATRRPIPQAKVRCLVWSWYDIWTFTSSESDYSDAKPRTLQACDKGDPDLSFCHPSTAVTYASTGPGQFISSQRTYWGYQSYFWLGPLLGNDRFGHFAGTLVQAPGYCPILVEIDQIDPLPLDFSVHDCPRTDPFQSDPSELPSPPARLRDDGTLEIQLTRRSAAAGTTKLTK